MVERSTGSEPAHDGVVPSRSWLAQTITEIDGLAADAEDDGGKPSSVETLSFARETALVISSAGVSHPLLDHDGAGGVEIYLEEGERALLIALRSDGDLCVFRDGPLGQGRDRCQAGGDGWTSWLGG